MPVQTQFQVRRGTSTLWTTTNPVLANGEIGYETDTGLLKVGNGSSLWTALNYQAAIPPIITNLQTVTSYTLVLSDLGKNVELSNTSSITVTIPPSSSVAYPVGTQIVLLQTNTGQVTVTGGVGVTLNAPGNAFKLRTQWSQAVIQKRATDTWVLVGDITA